MEEEFSVMGSTIKNNKEETQTREAFYSIGNSVVERLGVPMFSAIPSIVEGRLLPCQKEME
jgi:hypothetical protein